MKGRDILAEVLPPDRLEVVEEVANQYLRYARIDLEVISHSPEAVGLRVAQVEAAPPNGRVFSADELRERAVKALADEVEGLRLEVTVEPL